MITRECHAGEAAVKLLDRTGDRRKLAVVNESNELKVVDTRSKELVFSAEGVSASDAASSVILNLIW